MQVRHEGVGRVRNLGVVAAYQKGDSQTDHEQGRDDRPGDRANSADE